MPEVDLKEVRFDIYCQKCEHKNLEEKFDPCNECLNKFMNENSEKPLFYKEDTK